MYLSIQLILPLLASFSDILCQDKIHRLPGPPVSKCRAKTKWLIIDEEGERWTILHRPRKVERFADQVIWYSYDMAPLDLGEVVANKKKELGIGELVKTPPSKPTVAAKAEARTDEGKIQSGKLDEPVDDEEWDFVEREDIAGGYVVIG